MIDDVVARRDVISMVRDSIQTSPVLVWFSRGMGHEKV